ncbi:unnamed protein product [Microthlaspi erraticum]|uniref:UBZ4-type domain-containing protein n=1 Tax=Microthlaspi erraticum TaxID=1685480 RepID=A0A6D2LQ19_9BRAS|nr:unnamed protein product [Microthlaspi erraticum]
MFLSTENPPNDPLSSSSNFLHLTTSSDELGQSHLPNFSIRDYAYSNRKRNINNNWPFSTKSLHLFATHGVTDPLPPFQKLSTVSNQFETTATSPSGKQIAPHVHRGRDLAQLKLNQTRKGVCNQPKILENGLFTRTSTKSSKVDQIVVASTNNSKNNHSRKMVKSKEDSCVTTSESTMASKTCPICRTFSSASNTTLNAHIDQCLSVDLPSPPVSHSKQNNKPRVDQCLSVDLPKLPPVNHSKPSKARVNKPRTKVKTMADIYASAKGCTLEDLDKRNGTNWVSILSYTSRVVADKSSEVSKKRKVSSPVGVGPVYIDAKGQKLRILSEFSEKKKTSFTTTPKLREQQEDCSSEKKCLSQGGKENSKVSRKRGRGKKQHKSLKLTNHKANASEQIPESESGFAGEGRSTGRRRIYNQRMLAKRGLTPKKLSVKEKGHKFYALRDQPSENDDDDDDSWSERDPVVMKGTDKQKLRSEVAGKNKTLFGNKRAQSRSFRVQMSEKEKDSLEGVQRNTLRLKKNVASIQEDAIKVSDASPRASSMRKLSPLYVANSWRRLSLPAELKKARFDFSDEEETGKWESEMNQEREISDDDDYVSGDNGERNEEVLLRSNLSSSGYDDYSDDDEEESSEEEADDNNNETANALDKTDDDTGADFYQSDTEIIPSERAMYYTEEVGDMVYGQGPCKEDVRFDTEVGGHGSLFVEVDTIPIPGPPGSFLPSPRDMGFDENLGNSSVITSQVQSSMDHLDRNSSESPVSAVSNFAAGRMSFPAELSSSSFRENLSLDIPSSSYSTTPMSFCGIAEAEPTAPSRFRNSDHESCCCQRKERNFECVTLNHHQASHLLQRRAASSSSMAMNLTKTNTCMDPTHPFEQSPSYMIQQDLDLQSKFSSRASLNGTVPPSPNPVLRLMGKDLMVMNQGEEASGSWVMTPTPQLLDPPTGLYFNTSLYLSNGFDSTHQPQTPKAQQAHTQASATRNNFDQVRYFSPS